MRRLGVKDKGLNCKGSGVCGREAKRSGLKSRVLRGFLRTGKS